MGRSPGVAVCLGLTLIAGVALWPDGGDSPDDGIPSQRGASPFADPSVTLAPAPGRPAEALASQRSRPRDTPRRRPVVRPSAPAPREVAQPALTRDPQEVELRYRILLQRESATPIQRDLALRIERDGRFACRVLLPSSPSNDGEPPAPVPGLEPSDQALLDAVLAAVGADEPGPIPLNGGRSWVQGERQRTPLGERTVGERRLRGTLVDARVFGVDRDGAQFLNTAQLEIWSDVEHGWPVLVMGQQRVRHGDAEEQRVDVLVEPAA